MTKLMPYFVCTSYPISSNPYPNYLCLSCCMQGCEGRRWMYILLSVSTPASSIAQESVQFLCHGHRCLRLPMLIATHMLNSHNSRINALYDGTLYSWMICTMPCIACAIHSLGCDASSSMCKIRHAEHDHATCI